MSEKHKHTVHHVHREKESKYLLPAVAVLALVLLTNVIVTSQSNKAVDDKINYAEKLANPANIEITTITAQCADCYDISGIANAIRQFNVKATEKNLESASPEAKNLIKKYNITKLPAIVVTGETERGGLDAVWDAVGTKEEDSALVLRIGAPFVDPASGEVRGRAELVLLSYPPCTGCYNVSQHESILNAASMVFSGKRTIDGASAEGRALIAKYNITKVPTALISPDAKYYDFPTSVFGGASVRDGWQIVGSVESDGWYVFRNIEALRGAVYYDLFLKKVINQTAV